MYTTTACNTMRGPERNSAWKPQALTSLLLASYWDADFRRLTFGQLSALHPANHVAGAALNVPQILTRSSVM